MADDELEILRSIAVHTPESLAVYDLDSRVRYVNPVTERLFGRTLAEMRGHRLFDLFPDAVGNPFHAAFVRVAAGGESEVFEHYYPPFEAWFTNRVVRVGGQVHVLARDVTEDVRRRRRLETLTRISEVLTNDDLDLPSANDAIVRILADVVNADCTVALLSADGAWLEVGATASPDPDVREVIQTVSRWEADRGHPGVALRTREAVLAQIAPGGLESPRSEDPHVRAAADRYAPSSVLAVPLLVGEDAIGVLIAARRRGMRPLTEDDRALAAEIAPSVGLYLAHARHRAEADLLRHRLLSLADAIPGLVAFIDRDLRYQFVNAGYEAWFGTPREEFLNRRVPEFTGPDGFKRLEPHLRRALSGAPVRFRTRFRYPSGERDVDAQYLPIYSAAGEPDGFGALVQDVTAEVRVAELEREGREAERRATRRLESLLALTGKLAGASRPDEIGRVLVDEGVDALEAALGGLWLLSPDGQALELLRERGFRPAHTEVFRRVPLASAGLLPECVQTAQPVWINSRAEYAARYPSVERDYRPQDAPPIAFAILPLLVEGRVAGCVNFTFHADRRLAADERTYLEVLASHGAEALRRARLYDELRDVSETRQAMIQASPAAIMLLDEAGVVHAWNPAAERIFGWSEGEVLGRLLPAVGDKREELLANLRYVLSGNVVQGREARHLRASGEWFDVELHAAPVHLSDGRALCLSMVMDISARKRIERDRQLLADASATLSRSLDLGQTLAEVVRLPLATFADWCCVDLLGADGALQRAARSGEDIAPGLEMPGRLAHEPERGGASLAITTRQPQLLRDIDDEARRRLARDEAHLRALQGLQMRSSLSVPLLAGGRAFGALSLASRVRNFDELDLSVATELAGHVATAIENARLFEEAKAASRAKDEFLAMLGHELRNPLAPMSTALTLMRLQEPAPFERERALIERQVAHLSRLVDDLLDVSRIARGKVGLQRRYTPIAAIVADAVELASPLLEQRGHHLALDIPEALAVHGDPTRLSQVVANLLSNAAKYTEAGGRIEIRAARQGDDVVLAIRDNGSGIAPDLLPRIFDVFVQAPQPSARSSGGLGLGLAIVRSLVEAHGGTVAAHSDGPGRGTEVTVQLPAAHHPPLEAEAPADVVPRARAGARRVLVVDDNEDAAALLAALLDAYGHESRAAFDGPSALQIAAEFRPDVAVLDIGLPVMDGYELAERLRAMTGLPALQLIAVTGYGQESARTRSIAAGFVAHLTKPVSIEALVQLVEQPGCTPG